MTAVTTAATVITAWGIPSTAALLRCLWLLLLLLLLLSICIFSLLTG